MKKAIISAALLPLLFHLSSPARAQGEFPLEYIEFQDLHEPLPNSAVHQYSPMRGRPPVAGFPKGLSRKARHYFAARFGGKDIFIILDTFSKPARLYADSDADGDLSDEKGYPAVEEEMFHQASRYRGMYFGTIPLGFVGSGEPSSCRFGFSALADKSGPLRLSACPAGCRSGEVRLGGEPFRVALVDNDFDGRYDGMDLLAVDLDRDGEFERSMEAWEILALPRMFKAEDTYYEVEVEPDGSSIRLQQVRPKLGTLDVGTSDLELILSSEESGVYHLFGTERKWELPEGRYRASRIGLRHTDKSGTVWTLNGRRGPNSAGKYTNFTIAPDSVLQLRAGPPLSAKTDVHPMDRDGRVYIALTLLGQAGEEYNTADAEKNGERVPPPRFRIVEESGRVLASGTFEYG